MSLCTHPVPGWWAGQAAACLVVAVSNISCLLHQVRPGFLPIALQGGAGISPLGSVAMMVAAAIDLVLPWLGRKTGPVWGAGALNWQRSRVPI